jgi:hypothetical protein
LLKVVIAVINASSLVGAEELAAVTAALQIQVSRDFAPAWNADAELVVVPPGGTPPPKCWWVIILDNSDLGTALGYHDLTADRLPMAKVFVETARQSGDEWSVLFSHEVLEMLADPYINLTAMAPTPYGTFLYAYENCDACQSQDYGYEVDGHLLSDFCLPSWFDAGKYGSGAATDHCGHILQPFELLPGGYAMACSLSYYSGWHLVLGPQAEKVKAVRPRIGSRRERRKSGLPCWESSTADPAEACAAGEAARKAHAAAEPYAPDTTSAP